MTENIILHQFSQYISHTVSEGGQVVRSGCYCPPTGNKITDAGVPLDTLMQHQDIVPRETHTHTLVFQVLSVPGLKKKGRKE